MQQHTTRGLRFTVAAGSAAAALLLLSAAPASAAPGAANSSAYAVKVTVTLPVPLGTITVGPLPGTRTCPTSPGGTTTLTSITLGNGLGGTGVANATALCNDTAGTSSAIGDAAAVAIPAIGPLPAIAATLIRATCTDTAPGAPSGTSTLTAASVGQTALAANPAPNTNVANVPGVATLTLNEQSTTNGVFTVNALHLVLAGGLGDIIIGHVTCGPNTPVAGTPILTKPFYVGFGAIAILVFSGYLLRRRALANQV